MLNPAMNVQTVQVPLSFYLAHERNHHKKLEADKIGADVKWGNLEHRLSDAQILFLTDQQKNVQKVLPHGEGVHIDLDHFKDSLCDLILVKWTERECTKFHTPKISPW